jgi:D-aminopeptidase
VTAIVFDEPAVASVAILGGAPAVRDTALLAPEMTVDKIDAVLLSGGSAFGLDAAGGAMSALAETGRGFSVGPARVPIVPQAALFDLLNGADKAWGPIPPFFRLGHEAVLNAGDSFRLGTAGAGYGATTANLKGGLGSASAVTSDGSTVAAIAAVNAVGGATVGEGPHFWAAPYERNAEFGGVGLPLSFPLLDVRLKGSVRENTTIAVVVTDACLTKAEALRIAISAHDGLARALRPGHTPMDGDTVFVAATGCRPLANHTTGLAEIAMLASDTLARSIARGVYEATALPFPGAIPSWKDKFG